MIALTLTEVRWPLHRPFRIARAEYHHVEALRLELVDDHGHRGWAEALGDDAYGETVASMRAQLGAWSDAIARADAAAPADALLAALPRGGARHLLDAAWWDLRAKHTGVSAFARAGVEPFAGRATAFTVGLGGDATGDGGALEAELDRVAGYPVLKIKVDGTDPIGQVERVRGRHGDAELIVDANASWTADQLAAWFPELARRGVVLLEQPLAVGADAALAAMHHPVPVAADESVTDRASLAGVVGRYDAVNIKLDKTGGLTEALRLVEAARARALGLMVGCMGGSSLAMAPATVLVPHCRWVDLDGPLLQREDVEPAMRYDRGRLDAPPRGLWG